MLTDDQIEARRHGIGGSEAAAVCGLDPFRQRVSVWLEKVEGIRDETIGDKEVVRWGNLLEDTVANEWAERMGIAVRRDNRHLAHPDLPWMRGNIDRRVKGSKQGLEVKTRGFFASEDYGPSGTDQVKTGDIMQCMHYMAVTGWGIWHMAVLIGGQELRHYTIPRDDGLIDDLINTESAFWDSVVKRERPPMDYTHRDAGDLIKRLYPGTNGEIIDLGAKGEMLHEEMANLTAINRNSATRIKEMKNEIADLLGESAGGTIPGGGGWRRKLVERKGYEVKPSSYIDMRFTKKLGD